MTGFFVLLTSLLAKNTPFKNPNKNSLPLSPLFLTRHLDGKLELRGGTVEDQREARAWVGRFLPDVLASLPCPPDRGNK